MKSVWVVVTSPGAFYGRVGLVNRDLLYINKDRFRFIEVQFGNSGPFKQFSRGSLMEISLVIKQIEDHTGAPYDWSTS